MIREVALYILLLVALGVGYNYYSNNKAIEALKSKQEAYKSDRNRTNTRLRTNYIKYMKIKEVGDDEDSDINESIGKHVITF